MSPDRRRLLELVAVLDEAALAVVLPVAEALARSSAPGSSSNPSSR